MAHSKELIAVHILLGLWCRVCCWFCEQNFQVFGYARSKMTDAEFREMITATLTCRVNAR